MCARSPRPSRARFAIKLSSLAQGNEVRNRYASARTTLTARNFEGPDVRLIVLGEQGRGGTARYDSTGVEYEDWCTKEGRLRRGQDGREHGCS